MRTATVIALLSAAFSTTALAREPLTAAEQAAGWKSLSEPTAWRGYKQEKLPGQGWVVKDGEFRQAPPGGGDIETTQQFGDFEFCCSFKLDDKANSGIMWRVVDKHDTAWQTGPEYQLLEDHTYQGAQPGQMCGALYDLYPPAEGKKLNPAGQWNEARIRLGSGIIRQYLNGGKTVEARIFAEDGKPTREWLDKIAASKFKAYDGFGLQAKGAIALQDHGGGVAFKDLKVRDPSAPMPGEIALFNGKDLSGWKAIVPEAEKAGIKPESVWEVKDGILICKGNPVGYIRTDKDYTNYVLKLEWRFNPVTKKAGNSGVLLRMVGEDKVWPKSVEAQLQSGSAGDFWNIDEFKMTTEPSRLNGRNTKKTHGNENPVGEWNEYEIIVDHGTVTLKVNGEVLNEATEVEELAGKICLQSEGAEIQFRNIRLVEIK
ncbi:MAG: DUF1080 domain-containing protein [Phycisphaerales bacterium]|nr:DUF1080 domain-containing protein [Phycisphaerales bacterium]